MTLDRIFAKAAREAAIIRAGGGVFLCHACAREFFSVTEEKFCSRACRLSRQRREAESNFDLPPVEEEETTDPVFDPRVGRYRTRSWDRWA